MKAHIHFVTAAVFATHTHIYQCCHLLNEVRKNCTAPQGKTHRHAVQRPEGRVLRKNFPCRFLLACKPGLAAVVAAAVVRTRTAVVARGASEEQYCSSSGRSTRSRRGGRRRRRSSSNTIMDNHCALILLMLAATSTILPLLLR